MFLFRIFLLRGGCEWLVGEETVRLPAVCFAWPCGSLIVSCQCGEPRAASPALELGVWRKLLLEQQRRQGSREEGHREEAGEGEEPTACNWDREALGALDLRPVAGGEEGGLECPRLPLFRFYGGIQARKSLWRPSRAMSSSATTCHTTRSRAARTQITLAFRHPAAQWADAAHGQVGRLRQPVPQIRQSGSLSTWAREPLKPWWNPPTASSTTTLWHDVRVTRNLRQVGGAGRRPGASGV